MDDMTRRTGDDEREARDARAEHAEVPRDARPRSPAPAADPAAGRARLPASGRAPGPNPGRATGATAAAPPEPRDLPVDGQLDGLHLLAADEQGEPIDDDRLPPRLRTAVSMILASGEAGAEEVVRGLVEVHRKHRALWEAARSQVSTSVAQHRAPGGPAAGIPRSPGNAGP